MSLSYCAFEIGWALNMKNMMKYVYLTSFLIINNKIQFWLTGAKKDLLESYQVTHKLGDPLTMKLREQTLRQSRASEPRSSASTVPNIMPYHWAPQLQSPLLRIISRVPLPQKLALLLDTTWFKLKVPENSTSNEFGKVNPILGTKAPKSCRLNCALTSYIEVLILSTSECDLIWKKDHYQYNYLRWGHASLWWVPHSIWLVSLYEGNTGYAMWIAAQRLE
jgi:hypothetical protein